MALQYTCISCRVAFGAAEIQRNHYKTDWHRYNLKRKVAELPPVTAEEFQRRVLQQREINQVKNDSVFCKVCRKTFGTGKAFENHLNSKRHKSLLDEENSEDVAEPVREKPSQEEEEAVELPEAMDEDSDIESVDSEEWDDEEINDNNPILRNNCLFCFHHSATMTKNLKHMTLEHSFFIPDVDYVTDMRGLLLYLGEKVSTYYMCLWCSVSGKSFHSFEAAQQHMRDKGHCKMLHEGQTLIEYYPYYNYARSYPDADTKDVDIDEEILTPLLNDENYELTLPSGAKIGHRSLMVYYKQYFNPDSALVERKPKNRKLLTKFKAIGWTESDKTAVERKARDMHFLQRVQSKYYAKLGVKGNKLQRHFRPQVNF